MSGYAASYLTRDVGPKLWQLLGQALGETVSKNNFQTALERRWIREQGDKGTRGQGEMELVNPPLVSPSPHPPIPKRSDWGEAVDVSIFYGRTEELNTLKHWLLQKCCRLVALLGMGGVGKTCLSVKLAQQIQSKFDAVIWRSLRHAPPPETLSGDLVSCLSNQKDTKADLGRLINWLRTSRCLIILDNVEAILQPGSVGKYLPGYEDYGELFRLIGTTVHQNCLILTSREKTAEVAELEGIELGVLTLQLNGSLETAQALIQTQELSGSAAQQKHLCELYDYNPLLLKIVANSIQELFDGHIAKFLAQNTLVFNGIRRSLEQQFHRLSPVEQTIMKPLAIAPDGLTIAELAQEIGFSFSRADVLRGLEALSWRSLIEKASPTLIQRQSSRYTQPSIVREYVNDRMIGQAREKLKLQSVSVCNLYSTQCL